MSNIAKGFIKKRIEEHGGVEQFKEYLYSGKCNEPFIIAAENYLESLEIRAEASEANKLASTANKLSILAIFISAIIAIAAIIFG